MIQSLPKVTINAAFLKEIKDDNLNLYSLLENLRSFWLVNDPLVLNPEWFSALVNQLRDQLAIHFALEETFGYFDHPVIFDVFLSEEAKRLKDQHVELYLEINLIAEKSEEMLYPDFNETSYTTLVNQFKKFYQSFQQHEVAEFDLIMRVSHEEHKRTKKNILMHELIPRER
tara:strand:+ start:2224 stop:2739 length:516 start_codon:yes stop_codon:yes gene_type:complete